ncbi:MAG: MBL fold metallo-hydrolase [Bacteroidales bacterium]|nr:MBL fold metallo-hydrolase [Bacteroidales bacterium]
MILLTTILLASLLLSLNVLFRAKLLHRTWGTLNGYAVTCILSRLSNVFLVQRDGLTVLVDSGLAQRRAKLDKRLRRYGVMRIDYLVLTHSHFDHAGNAAHIRRAYGAQVVIHRAEAQMLARGQSAPFVGASKLWRWLMRSAYGFNPTFEPCPPDIVVDDRHQLDGPGITLMHTPGHTSGSISAIVDGHVALVGDVLLGVFSFSINNPFAESPELMRSSWQKLLKTHCRLFLPGHGSLKRLAHLRWALR